MKIGLKNLKNNHRDHLGSSSYLTDYSGAPSHYYDYLPFGEEMVSQNNSTYNNVYKFSGKEFDKDTGLSYFGARYYDPKWSIWLSVDPLAEKYPNVSPYAYCLNNPIVLIDPDGRDVLPYYVRTTLPVSGYGKYEYGKSTPAFISAMKDFMKTSYGGNFVSQFMKKDQNVYGYTSKSDGKYSMYDLNIIDVNIKDPGKSGAFMTDEGSFDVTEKKGGGLAFTMYVNDAGSKASNGEIIDHEAALHGVDVDQIVKAYNKGGMEAVDKLRNSDPKGEGDHRAIRDNDKSHPGVKTYNQVKSELIKMDGDYKVPFQKAKELYEYQYKNK